MFWCCAQIEPDRERLALHCLGLNGFEVYCPRLGQQGHIRGRKGVRTPALVLKQFFVQIISTWWSARWSAGVRRLVMDGELPAKVPDAVIAEIRSRERNGLVELVKPRGFVPGMRVRVISGPLSEKIGLLAVLRPHE